MIPDFCSHRRSWAYYAESVRSVKQKTFNCVKCKSWNDFKNNSCEKVSDNFDAFMGIDADPRMSGDYFLQTNADEPFNRGVNGLTYEFQS